MDNNEYIAQIRVSNSATVQVLRISPNEVITCDQQCVFLEKTPDGSIQCFMERAKHLDDFHTTALVIDYEIILDKDADREWPVRADDFLIVDETGLIHKGFLICDKMLSPKGLSRGINRLYPGTRGQYRVYYETFPKDGKVASIIAGHSEESRGRVDLLPTEPDASNAYKEERERGCAFFILLAIGVVVCILPAIFLIHAYQETSAFLFMSMAIGLIVVFVVLIVIGISMNKEKKTDVPEQSGPLLYDQLKTGILFSLLLGQKNKHKDDSTL